jgi:putative spermidine/putrescine transport system substrate-binding protein
VEPAAEKSMTVAGPGGAFQESQRFAFYEPFQKDAGIKVKVASETPTLEMLARDDAPDLVTIPADLAAQACRDGALEKLDVNEIAGSDIRGDFLPGGVDECSIANTAWSNVFIFDRRVEGRREPSSLQDLFDLRHFPGKRAFPRSGRYLLEIALLADGVPPADVYTMLATPEGLKRAFLKLDRIRTEIVLWDRPEDAITLLSEKKAAFALTYNGRAFDTIVRDRQPFGLFWASPIYDLDVWAIPKKAAHKDAARAFLRYVLEPKRLAEQTRYFPYGPARLSASALAGKHIYVNVDMTRFLSTTASHFRNALRFNAAFWSQNETALSQRLADWMEHKINANGDVIPPPPPPSAKAQAPRRRGRRRASQE